MTTLIRWNPVRDIVSIRRQMDRLFDTFMDETLADRLDTQTWGLALDIAEKDDAFIVKASVPGVKPEDLDVSLNDNTLTIRGEVKSDETIEEGQYHVRERRYGHFTRTLTLPRTVNRDAIDASYENGVLTLHIPKSEEVQPRRITVKTAQNGHHKVIEGETVK